MLSLVGTGFVGQALMRQLPFDRTYNTQNISGIESCDELWCAGMPGTKWLANLEPEKDLASLKALQASLSSISFGKLVLISTIDAVVNVHQPYGKHRAQFECWCIARFPCIVVRLPGLYGDGLKKNAIYDMLHGRFSYVNLADRFQWYWVDDIVRDVRAGVYNLMTEPVSNADVADVLGVTGTGWKTGEPVSYAFGPYIQDRKEVLGKLEAWNAVRV